MELKTLYLSAKERVRDSGADIPDSEISLLLYETLGHALADIYSNPRMDIGDRETDIFYKVLDRRINGEPSSYITGHGEFFSRNFFVDNNVLIPRPETEILVEKALDVLPITSEMIVMDAGSGSGCISVTITLERPGVRVIATDISYDALGVSRLNALKYGVDDRILFARADLLSCIRPGYVDVLISNPPYISESDYRELHPEVREYEPGTALLGGIDGMDFIRRLVSEGKHILKQNGFCFIETGYDQADVTRELFSENHYSNVTVYSDLNGIKRVVSAQWKK